MDGLSGAASVIAVIQICGNLFDLCRTYATSVKDARKDITRLRDEITALESVLTSVRDLEDTEDRVNLATLSLLKKDDGPLQRCLEDLQYLETALDPGDGAQRMRRFGMRALKWPLARKDVDRVVEMMERYKVLFTLALTGDNTTLSLAIKRILGGLALGVENILEDARETRQHTAAIRSNVAATHTAVESTREDTLAIRTKVEEIGISQEARMKEKLYKDIITWLWTSDPSTNYNAACKLRQPGTGQWLLDCSNFEDWKHTKGALLWLHGIPGCGKTVMSSTIIQHLTEMKTPGKTAVAYYFFAFNDTSKQSPANCLSSLVAQICTAIADFPEELADLYKKCGKGQRSPEVNEMQRILSYFARDSRLADIYIVIDALDECPKSDASNSRRELLSIISSIQKLPEKVEFELPLILNMHGGKAEMEADRSTNIHLLVTSRQEADIGESLSQLSAITSIPIQIEEVDSDIQIYVATEVAKDPGLVSWSNEIKSQIEKTIARGAHGMFRWAYCQLDSLRKCKKKPALLRALQGLPKTLDDTYERILLGIDEDYWAEAHRALMWLSFSQRPLTISELAEAAVIDPGELFDPDERFHNPERDIIDILGSLVTVSTSREVTSSGFSPKEFLALDHVQQNNEPEYREEIRLSHYSVKEYLISDRLQRSAASKFSACTIVPALWCTKVCLRYITDVVELGLVKKLLRTEFQSDSSEVPTLNMELHPFLEYASTQWYHHAAGCRSQVEASFSSLLSGVYLSNTVYETWSHLAAVTGTPLYQASNHGFISVVEQLLKNGASVLERGDKGETALHAAARRGFVETSLLLLTSSNGSAILDARDGYGRTVLHEAALHGNNTLISKLLETQNGRGMGSDYSADVRALDHSHKQPLHYACAGGHADAAALLLLHGADSNSVDSYRNTPLQVALNWHDADSACFLEDSMALLRTLFAYSGDPNIRNWSGDSALHVAVDNGHSKDVVALLLDNGATINAKGFNFRSALHIAVYRDLIEPSDNFTNVSRVTHPGEPLESEAKSQQRIDGLLLHRDWGRRYGVRASWNPKTHRDVLRLLLERGADTTARDHNHKCPIHLASPACRLVLDEWNKGHGLPGASPI